MSILAGSQACVKTGEEGCVKLMKGLDPQMGGPGLLAAHSFARETGSVWAGSLCLPRDLFQDLGVGTPLTRYPEAPPSHPCPNWVGLLMVGSVLGARPRWGKGEGFLYLLASYLQGGLTLNLGQAQAFALWRGFLCGLGRTKNAF